MFGEHDDFNFRNLTVRLVEGEGRQLRHEAGTYQERETDQETLHGVKPERMDCGDYSK